MMAVARLGRQVGLLDSATSSAIILMAIVASVVLRSVALAGGGMDSRT